MDGFDYFTRIGALVSLSCLIGHFVALCNWEMAILCFAIWCIYLNLYYRE